MANNDPLTKSSLSVESDGEHAPRGITKMTAIFNLVTGVIGVGIFALAEQAKDAGLFGSLVFCSIGALAVYEGGMLFSDCMLAWNKQCEPHNRITSFEMFGNAAFGPFGKAIVTLMNCTYYLGVCSTYVIVVGNALCDVANLEARGVSRKTVRMFFVPLYLGLPMLKDLTSLAKLSPLAVGFSILFAYAIVSQAFFDLGATDDWEAGDRSIQYMFPQDFMPACRVFAFMFAAFGISGMIPTQANEMRDKTQLPSVLKGALATVLFIYILVIVFGYMAYGNFICPDFVINMRAMPANFQEASANFDENWALKRGSKCDDGWTGNHQAFMYYLAVATVIPNLLLSYPFNLMSVICAIQETEHATREWPVGSAKNYIMRLVLAACTLVVAILLDDINTALGTFAAFTLPFVTVFFPVAFNWSIRKKLEMDQVGRPRMALHVFLVLGGVLAFVFGLYVSIQKIVAQHK